MGGEIENLTLSDAIKEEKMKGKDLILNDVEEPE